VLLVERGIEVHILIIYRTDHGMFKTSGINAVFSKNVSMHIKNNDSDDRILVAMYNQLAGVIETIQALLKEYSLGHFYTVANILTLETYNKLSIRLSSLAAKANKFPNYEIIRTSNTAALAGLYQSIIQYSEYIDVKHKLEISIENESVLYDRVKLQEHINRLNQRKQLFPDSKVQVKKATLKPEYAEYIKNFGFPEGGIFDPDKLAFVLQKLGMR
jgi:hypothetical protein